MPTVQLSTAVQQDLEIFEGNTLAFQLDFENDDTTELDITEWTFVMDIRNKNWNLNCGTVNSGNFQSLTIGKGLSISAPNSLIAQEDLTIVPGNYKYNLNGTDAEGIKRTVMYGSIKVNAVV